MTKKSDSFDRAMCKKTLEDTNVSIAACLLMQLTQYFLGDVFSSDDVTRRFNARAIFFKYAQEHIDLLIELGVLRSVSGTMYRLKNQRRAERIILCAQSIWLYRIAFDDLYTIPQSAQNILSHWHGIPIHNGGMELLVTFNEAHIAILKNVDLLIYEKATQTYVANPSEEMHTEYYCADEVVADFVTPEDVALDNDMLAATQRTIQRLLPPRIQAMVPKRMHRFFPPYLRVIEPK